MKEKKIIYSCVIDAPPADVCKFHTDTNNLLVITPPWISVEIVKIDAPLVKNSKITLRIKRFCISTKWVMEIEEMDCPRTVIDRMISGPFREFRHQRVFEQLSPSKTKMTETITLRAHFGVFGALFLPLIERDINKMFAYRHQATIRHFDKPKA